MTLFSYILCHYKPIIFFFASNSVNFCGNKTECVIVDKAY